ncbi:hypothetical protein I3842_10G159900, partial [Carya illinoinensis]
MTSTMRRRRNNFSHIKNSANQWINDPQIYQSSHPIFPIEPENPFPKKISTEDNASLCKVPSDEEILATIKQIPSSKSPSPDGFTEDLRRVIKHFFVNGHFLQELNHTYIALIPKTDSPNIVHQFRPISLSNVCYKIIAKILANRLKKVLNLFISPYQFASLDRKNMKRGLETLLKHGTIKAVAMSIPMYAMSCFLLPKSFCKELEMMVAKFWWGNQGQGNKIHWVSWEKLSNSKFRGGMGFKDLHLFNLALLTKQGWRLLRNEGSLVHRVFKAKYFPNTSLFEAKLRNNSSYVWKGILVAIIDLKRGCRWRVGNGKSVNVFKDPWIPDYYLPPNNSEVDEDLKVHSLIDINMGWWNIQALRALFNPNVIQKILQLNISVHAEDSLFWVHEKNGIYSVRSAYRMLQQDISNDMEQHSRESLASVFWKCLWHLKLPKKIKIFAWRACHEKLPTFQKLKLKHVLENDICAFCSSCVEDAAHALFYCNDVRQVWMDYCPELGEIVSDLSFWDLANLARDRGSHDVLTTFLVVAWRLWNRRNKFIYEDVSLNINTAVNNALPLKQEYTKVQVFHGFDKRINHVVYWHPPPIGCLKLNVDGATFSDSFSAGVGVILRDHNGDVVVAASKVEREVSSAVFIEAIALLRGLQLCVQWGVPKIILESDSLILVNCLNEDSECLTEFDFILQDIRRLMHGFEETRLEHVHRLGNGAAHQLARYAREVEDIVMWWDSCPSF